MDESIFGFLKPAMLNEALSYAARGWYVFPCYESGTKAKAPRTPHGLNDATTDAAQIRAWWSQWPGAAIGLSCGASGLIAIDLDTKHGHNGLATWATLGIPEDGALLSQTPSGGKHIVFRQNGIKLGNTAGKIGDGIDTRGHGGYIIAPPSRLDGGGSYTALNSWTNEPATIPDKLASMLDRPTAKPPAHTPTQLTTVTADDPWALAALESECGEVAATTNGTRNDALNAAAFALGQLVSAGYLSESDVVESLRYAAADLAATDGQNSVDATIRSGLDAGKMQPRYKPERLAAVSRAKQDATPDAGTLTPGLPDYAQLTPEQLETTRNAGAWLDDYIAFATEASPLTPRSFHEAAGLFVGSLMIARRLHLPVSTESNWIYPNLYLLFVGQSTRPRKTTALKVLQGLIRESGLSHFLRPGRNTPEGFIADSGTQLPRDYDDWQPDAQQAYLKERAIAAQRGMVLEEASHLLDSFSRDFTSGLLPLVMDLYDCGEEVGAKLTVSRGREGIKDAYLSIFGATTYGSMAEHFDNPVLWHNGLFARFAFIGSDTDGSWRFWPDNTPYPVKLTSKLRFIAERLFPMPDVSVVELEVEDNDDSPKRKKDDEKKRKVKILEVSPLESSAAIITPEAWRQWELYSRAVSYDMIPETPEDIDPQFYANYGRLGTMLIKVAMILAVFDADRLPVRVEAKHVYRAQVICEGWRASLHDIAIHTDDVTGANLVTRVKAVIAESGSDWTAGRDIYKKLKLRKSDVEDVLTKLVEVGEVETRKQGKSDQYRIKVK